MAEQRMVPPLDTYEKYVAWMKSEGYTPCPARQWYEERAAWMKSEKEE